MNKYFLLCCLVFIMLSGFRNMGVERIMMRMESQSLHKGKRVDVRAELYYQSLDGRLVTKYVSPVTHIMVTTNKGEVAIYDEAEHTVYREQSLDYSTDNHLIYYFLSGRIQDLGLRQIGFELAETGFVDDLVKTTWFPPNSLWHLFSRIELVHENHLPIYAGYYDSHKNLVKKVFYTDYQNYSEVILPTTITEFNYLPGNDSIVNRIRFSDIKINREASSPWFQFRIPEDAKVLD